MATYDDVRRRSLHDPEEFWGDAAHSVSWARSPSKVFDGGTPPFGRWFPDGELNTCHNALDRHVAAGRGGQIALVHDSPVTGTVSRFTYDELLDAVARAAGGLRRLGVGRGDRVVIYMPMIPEAVIAMLACARLGAIHSVVFGGFAPAELAVRIDDAGAKVLLTASCAVEGARVIDYAPLWRKAIGLTQNPPETVVVVQRDLHRTTIDGDAIEWTAMVDDAPWADCEAVRSTDPLYILYTSGTTGKPKGVVRDNGGHAVALAWSMANIFGAGVGDTFWAASDVGWVVGHSYIVYGPLIAGCTTVMYEGKPVGSPDAGAFWRVVRDHAVNVMFTAPTALRAIRKEDPSAILVDRDAMSCLRTLFVAGERLDPETYGWASSVLGIPVIDHWWQTETGWPIAGNVMSLDPHPPRVGSCGKAMPGFDVRIVADDGAECDRGAEGAVVIRWPLPPGTLSTLWQDDERFEASYFGRFPGCYFTGDGGRMDDDGYLYVMGRIDDVINVAGHRLSSGAIEEVLARHPAVAECAVVGVADELRGQVPRGFVVVKSTVDVGPAALQDDLVRRVRDEIGAVACLRRVDVVTALPKTRSGKILRRSIRAIVEGRPEPVPATIEDPATLDALRMLLTSSASSS